MEGEEESGLAIPCLPEFPLMKNEYSGHMYAALRNLTVYTVPVCLFSVRSLLEIDLLLMSDGSG